MAQPARLTRRVAGILRSRLSELQLEQVVDPRHRRGRRWKHLPVLLRAVLVGLMAGCKGTQDAEALTDEMSVPMRRMLKIPRRVPDTTLRQTLIRLEPDELRSRLHAQVKVAHRRKALAPVGLPFGQVAIDGRSTALPDVAEADAPKSSDVKWAEKYAQRHKHDSGCRYRLMRTDTCTLVSAQAKPCIDAVPIPARTHEMGHFTTVLRGLVETYGRSQMFTLVSADAGNCSEKNARLVVELDLHYLLRLKADQPTLLGEARRLLGPLGQDKALAQTEDVVGRTTETRWLYLTDELAGFLDWEHLGTVLRIHKKRDIATGELIWQEEHYALSSLPIDALSPAQWLYAFRAHWGVENQCHNTWDTAFKEDDKPWIKADPKGMMAVLLLRRMAYNLLALYRSVTQRSDERRHTPWKTLLRWVYNTLIKAQAVDIADLRTRKAAMSAI
ncbi:MAG: ISAs1 family transposase [Oligoflexia bacterium]|nr:ISAs1 family transposase [Oligoflexia bacterium]